LAKDAGRYRFVRAGYDTPEAMDAAIDAAMTPSP
jgi:hypothetical protein